MLLPLLLPLLATILACTTGTPAAPADSSYPFCALSCLFCPDTDYTHNFANNCAYAAGDCCTSSQHLTISETFTCVLTVCNSTTTAQTAFDTFQSFCQAQNKPLSAEDVPAGYTFNKTLSQPSPSQSAAPTSETSGLPTRTKIILATTLPATFLIGLLVGIAWWFVRRGRDQDEAKSDGGSQGAGEDETDDVRGPVHELDAAVGAGGGQTAKNTRRESGCFSPSVHVP
ncbi:hypothetical protein B0H67DRAFT_103113 [Lasiosphaeris hirsuta]|uniref:Extracellular membrane protein CFEM domain-containing protein n=1 Tax=Lasiosphaeris hirsuta TaxID=260670 RepID=A0AA40AYJ9_9PEZI|nr:hypothetical protein B0H67DRAFT_103113 [Lasiosphaeris hirsuta]